MFCGHGYGYVWHGSNPSARASVLWWSVILLYVYHNNIKLVSFQQINMICGPRNYSKAIRYSPELQLSYRQLTPSHSHYRVLLSMHCFK